MKYMLREAYYFLVMLFMQARHRKLRLGFRAKIAPNSSFEGSNKIEHHSYFAGEMGFGTYIGEYSNFHGKTGRYCSIGGKVMVLSLTHPVRQFVSTSPCFYSTKKQNGFTYVDCQRFDESLFVEGTKFPVVVGNDVYIGYGATIIAPVVIGDGAVIAAGAVVTKNVNPYTIVAGNPAKEIGKRFTDDEIENLQNIQWWNQTPQWISSKIESFDNIQSFIKSCEK